MLGFMRPYSAVASYEAGFKLLEVSQFAIRPVHMVFFPIIAGMAAHQNWEQIKSLLNITLWITGSFGIIITAVVLTLADPIIKLIFGQNYHETAMVIKILFLIVPILYMGFVSTFFSSALHIEKMAGWIMLIGVVLNIILNAIGIPLLGIIGAAWASVISQAIITVWLIRLNVKTLQMNRDRNNFNALPILETNR
jgi:O-antigen/teichoic acid export membrane protein